MIFLEHTISSWETRSDGLAFELSADPDVGRSCATRSSDSPSQQGDGRHSVGVVVVVVGPVVVDVVVVVVLVGGSCVGCDVVTGGCVGSSVVTVVVVPSG